MVNHYLLSLMLVFWAASDSLPQDPSDSLYARRDDYVFPSLRNACKCILEQVPCQYTYYTFITFHHTTFDQFAYACQRGGRGGLAAEARAIYDGFRCQDFSVGYLFNQTIAFFNYPSGACEAYQITELYGGSGPFSPERVFKRKKVLYGK